MPEIPSNGRVLLTDGVIRRTLAAVRDLGRHGIQTTVGEETRLNVTYFSRYTHHHFIYPSPRKQPQAFAAALIQYLEQNPHECLFPMEQDTLDIILQHRQEIEALTRLPWPDNDTYRVFRDKGRTIELARRIGIPHPKTVLPTSLETLAEEVQGLKFPTVIKPRANWASRGLRVAEDMNQLLTTYHEVHAQYPFPLVQEMIPPGEQFHVCCLMGENARPIAFCAQKELRHYPMKLGLGVSTVQESVDRPDLVDLSRQLLQANNWYGVANTDFMIDPRDGTPMLMEVNPRFWGPLQSSIHAGVHFPHLLYRVARGEKVEPITSYPLGVLNRSFLPYDILHFITNPNRWRMEPSFFDFFGPNVNFDIISRHDPLPVAGFFLTLGRYVLDPEVWTRLAHMEKMGKFISRLSGQKVKGPDDHFAAHEHSVGGEING